MVEATLVPQAAPLRTPFPFARRARRWAAWSICLGSLAAFAFGYLCPELSGESKIGRSLNWLAFGVRTFTFQAGLGLLIILAWCAIGRLWRPALFLAALAAIALLPAAWSFRPRSAAVAAPSPTFTVMSCNLLVGSRGAEGAIAQIAVEHPDVILFQEYSSAAHALLAPALRGHYPHIIEASRDDAFGQAIYSKFAPIGMPMPFPPTALGEKQRTGGVVNLSDPQIRVVLSIAGNEVVVQNVHTMPPLSPSHLAEQRRLIRWLADFAASEPRPIVMGGDFNATYASLRDLDAAGLDESHKAAGRGRGSTWVDKTLLRHLPGFRIDHIYFGHGLMCESAHVANSTGSDHRPIMATFRANSPVP